MPRQFWLRRPAELMSQVHQMQSRATQTTLCHTSRKKKRKKKGGGFTVKGSEQKELHSLLRSFQSPILEWSVKEV